MNDTNDPWDELWEEREALIKAPEEKDIDT
jgi:hypothetical protein